MIEVKNICKAYGENIIFNHLKFEDRDWKYECDSW